MPPETNNPDLTPRQQSIPGTEPDHPEVAYRIERWLEAKAAREHALEIEQAADDAVLMTMTEQGVPHYPYTDPKSGKRKYRYVDTSPRIKSVSARPDAQPEQADEPTISEDSTAAETPATDTEVTHRRVPRATAEAELAAIAEETRLADNADNPMAQGAAAVDGALRPARNWDEEDDAQPEQADEPPRELTRVDMLEPYEQAHPAVQPIAAETEETDPAEVVDTKPKAERFDAALLSAGKCALRYEGGAGCELDLNHAGLHVSAVHKWKARRPKPNVTLPSLLEQAEQAQDAASRSASAE